MSKPEDYQSEDKEEPFNVADHLDEPNVIEAHIGDLQVEIERLHAVLDQIDKLACSVIKE
jgi:hypothetical protein